MRYIQLNRKPAILDEILNAFLACCLLLCCILSGLCKFPHIIVNCYTLHPIALCVCFNSIRLDLLNFIGFQKYDMHVHLLYIEFLDPSLHYMEASISIK